MEAIEKEESKSVSMKLSADVRRRLEEKAAERGLSSAGLLIRCIAIDWLDGNLASSIAEQQTKAFSELMEELRRTQAMLRTGIAAVLAECSKEATPEEIQQFIESHLQ